MSASSSAIMLCQPDAGRAVPGVSGAAASSGAGVFQGVGAGLAAAAGSRGVFCACAVGGGTVEPLVGLGVVPPGVCCASAFSIASVVRHLVFFLWCWGMQDEAQCHGLQRLEQTQRWQQFQDEPWCKHAGASLACVPCQLGAGAVVWPCAEQAHLRLPHRQVQAGSRAQACPCPAWEHRQKHPHLHVLQRHGEQPDAHSTSNHTALQQLVGATAMPTHQQGRGHRSLACQRPHTSIMNRAQESLWFRARLPGPLDRNVPSSGRRLLRPAGGAG